jgi:hypothetical protein
MSHDEKVKAARAALQVVFGDTSVDPRTTLDSLSALRDEIDTCVAAIEEDLDEDDV